MFLPDGVHIYFANPSIETLECIQGVIDRDEPIVVHGRIPGTMSLEI